MILKDQYEIDMFKRTMEPHRFDLLTDEMQAVLLETDTELMPHLRIDWWQKILLAGLFDPKIGEIFIKGATGVGKGGSSAIGLNLWYDALDESRIHLTSRDYQHCKAGIYGEVCKWRNKMDDTIPGTRVMSREMVGDERNYVKILNPSVNDPTAGEKFSGAHAGNTLYCFDEASAAPDEFYKNALKNTRMIMALSNPRTMGGWFRSAYDELDDPNSIGVVPGRLRMRLCMTAGGQDCINVAQGRLKNPVAPKGGLEIGGKEYKEGDLIQKNHLETVKPLIPSQIDLAQFRSILSSPDKRIEVPVFGHGKFPEDDPDYQVISASWLKRHQDAWRDNLPVTCFGFDVARSLDGDRTVLCAGSDEGVAAFHEYRRPTTVKVVDEALKIAIQYYGIDLTKGKNPVCVDMVGVGSGVGDILAERGVWVIEFFGNGSAKVIPKHHGNLRTESYSLLGQRLDPAGPFGNLPFPIPPLEDLAKELSAPEKIRGKDLIRFNIEPKEKVKKKLQGHSPDLADALTYLFHATAEYHNLSSFFEQYHRPLISSDDDMGGVLESQADESGFDLEGYLAEHYGVEIDKPIEDEPEDNKVERYMDEAEEYLNNLGIKDRPSLPTLQDRMMSIFEDDWS